MRRLSRRAFLRGAGGAALALPFLEAMGAPRVAHATDGDFPLRVLTFVSFQGTLLSEWTPTGTSTSMRFRRLSSVLEPFRDSVVVVSGVGMESPYVAGDANGHSQGAAHLLTATGMASQGTAGGISYDQRAAQLIGGDTRFRSLEISVPGAGVPKTISYTGPGQHVRATDDPYALRDRLFLDGRAAAENAIITDRVVEDYQRLLRTVSGPDRERLEAHMETTFELEQRLRGVADSAGTEPPDLESLPAEPWRASMGYGPDPTGGYAPLFDIPTTTRVMLDFIVHALATDQTRVATFAAYSEEHPWLDLSDWAGWHDQVHAGPGASPDARERMVTTFRHYGESFAYLLSALAATPEGDGSMLDNTIVLWASEFGDGTLHNHRNVPYVIAGGRAAGIVGGRHLQFDVGTPHNHLLSSLLERVGSDDEHFGDARISPGRLAGL